MKNLIIPFFFISVASLTACKKSTINPDNSIVPQSTEVAQDKSGPSKIISLNLALKSPDGQQLSGVMVNVYDPTSTNVKSTIFNGVTDESGHISAKVSVPVSLAKVVIDPCYLRLTHNAQAIINNNAINATIGGGERGFSGDIVREGADNL